jgi:hypothetical protein
MRVIDESYVRELMKNSQPFLLEASPQKIEPLPADDLLILISLGIKPTSGHTIEVTAKTAEIIKDRAYLPIVIVHPQRQKNYAQIRSSPCMVIALKKANYHTVVIRGLEKWSVSMNTDPKNKK